MAGPRKLPASVVKKVRAEMQRAARPIQQQELGRLVQAFAPGPPYARGAQAEEAGRRIRATRAAVLQVSRQRGISPRKAGEELIRVRGEITEARKRLGGLAAFRRGTTPARTGPLTAEQVTRKITMYRTGVRPEVARHVARQEVRRPTTDIRVLPSAEALERDLLGITRRSRR